MNTLLPNYIPRLMLVGLLVVTGLTLDTQDLFARQDDMGSWSSRAPMPTARKEIANATVALGSKIYVVGGVTDTGTTTNALEVFDPATDTWAVAAPLPLSVWRGAAAAVDGVLYAFGGYRTAQFPFSPSNRVFAYDPATDTWTEKASMSQARGAMVAVAFDGKIHVFGGLGGPSNTALRLHETYDPATDTWETQAPMPNAQSGLTGAALDGRIYVVGGYRLSGGVVSQNFVEAYDPATGQWQSRQALPTARHGIAAAVMENKMLVFGGNATASVPSLSLEYDPSSDQWRQLTQMPIPVSFMGAAAVADTIYVIGGGAVNLNRFDGLALNRAFAFDDMATAVEEAPRPAFAATLHATYPNPFSEATTIRYTLPEATFVRLAVYDLMGRRVATLVERTMPTGTHDVAFLDVALAGGTYLVRLDAGGRVVVRPMQRVR